MPKIKNIYLCEQCGTNFPQWHGQCPECNAWGSIHESFVKNIKSENIIAKTPTLLSKVQSKKVERVSTQIKELDRVLGGGIVSGSVTLVGGDPGIGKSTILIQAISNLTRDLKTLYISGEESAEQIKLRAERLKLKLDQINIITEVNLELIIETFLNQKPDLVVIDSIQTLFTESFSSPPGSVTQVRECASQLTRYAKNNNCSVIIVGHVTKEGAIAGPRILEHIVDTVLYFEGDNSSTHRMIRSIKNRFGSVNEIGIFAMTEFGLKSIKNPSAIFLAARKKNFLGSSVMVTQEGTRPLLIEIQALVDNTKSGYPKRHTIGLESNRILMILAVLNKYLSIPLHEYDVFVNAVGGVKISEPASDLSVFSAIYSSFKIKPLPHDAIFFGEIGLSGEIRPVVKGQERISEAQSHGFKKIFLPHGNVSKTKYNDIEIVGLKRVEELIDFLNN